MNLAHELKHLPKIAVLLHWGIERVLRPEGWVLTSVRGGWNSYKLHKPGDPREFHFRWWPTLGEQIATFDAYQHGRRLGLITEKDIPRFVIAVKKGKRWM